MDEPCVLVVTSERYRPLAALTGRLLDRHWAGHPPVFYCGVAAGPDDRWLPRQAHPADWMGIVRDAARDVVRRGHRAGYLVLEDHPPLFPCHARHLNVTLPALLGELDAAYIGLNGWGQGKPPRGVVLGRAHLWLEHVSPDFLWKFQLHPALWRLPALEAILDGLVAELPLERRSPWAFERQAGRADAPVPDALKGKAYRVCGQRTTARPVRGGLVRLARVTAVGLRAATGRLLGAGARRRVEALATPCLHYYEGPYPLFRSGLLVRGALNPAAMRFLLMHRQRRLVREIRAAVAEMAPPPAAPPGP